MALSAVIPRITFFGNNGRPLVGGRVHTYVAGTSAPATTYKDAAQTQANDNPITLDARGEASIYLAAGAEYKFRLEDNFGALVMTQEPIYGALWPDQGSTLAAALAAPSGAGLVGHDPNATYEAGTVGDAINDLIPQVAALAARDLIADDYHELGDPDDGASFVRMAADNDGAIRLGPREYTVGQLNLPLMDRLQIIGAGMPTATAALDLLVNGTVIIGGINARAGHALMRDFGIDSGPGRGVTGAVDGLVLNSPLGGVGAAAVLENVASLGPTSAGTTHAILVQGYAKGSARGIYCGRHQFGLVVKCRDFVISDVGGDDCRTALVYPKSDVPAFAGDVADGTAGNIEISNVQHRAAVANIEASAVYVHASTAPFASARVTNVSQRYGLAALRLQGGGSIGDPPVSGVRAANIRGEGAQQALFCGGFTYDWSATNLEAINPRTGRGIYMDGGAFGWSVDSLHVTISDNTITGAVVMTAYGEGSWDRITVRNPFYEMTVNQAWASFSSIRTGRISGQCRHQWDTPLVGINGAVADASPSAPKLRILPGSVMQLEGRMNTTASANKFVCNLTAGTGKQATFACGGIDSGGNHVAVAVRLNDFQLSVEPSLPAGLQRIDLSNIAVAL